jgi:Rps23 Pro-64 3,4-dihydroxylase Tpa1-like proline 4-hydroxylase
MTLRTMQQWVTATKEMVNLMVSRREKREAENQPDIRMAVITVVTEEKEIVYRARQERRREMAQLRGSAGN